jgi:hypothetical protein
MKKYFILIILILSLTIIINDTSAVNVYVGVTINNLTDNPAAGCAGETGYGSQGRIRAIAAILPSYPIYFNLSKVDDGSTIWSGDGTDDTDYTIGDTMYLPESVDLTIGEDYNLFFDIDAIRVYLPLKTYGSFTKTIDDNYYITGEYNSGTAGYWQKSADSTCAPGGSITYVTGSLKVFNSRTIGTFSRITTNADIYDFKIGTQYNNLHTSSVGNFNIGFTIS